MYEQQVNEGLLGAMEFLTLYLIVIFVILIVWIVASWKIFVKAGKPGWAAIVPIYNLVVLLEIIEKPLWWLVLILFVPCINIVLLVLINIELGKKFGKDITWSIIFLILLPFIGYPMLAFGEAQFEK